MSRRPAGPREAGSVTVTCTATAWSGRSVGWMAIQPAPRWTGINTFRRPATFGENVKNVVDGYRVVAVGRCPSFWPTNCGWELLALNVARTALYFPSA